MNDDADVAEIREILDGLLAGDLTRSQAQSRLVCMGLAASGALGTNEPTQPETPPVADLGFARIDHDRARRRGFPEVVLAEGKRPEQVATIMSELASHHPNVLGTRADPATYEAVRARLPEVGYDPDARVLWIWRDREPRALGPISIVAAGTSDNFVAREAEICAEVMGNRVERIDDVGVAGIHRLLAVVDRLRQSRVIICVAGMEGALPSVVAGLVACPVIAVPTSVGYGAAFGGVAALLGSLATCAPGVSVVNIDNGFGAAYAASLICRTSSSDPAS